MNIHGVRVLIVDDNATNRRILKDMLANWGMKPATTSGGGHALRAIADANEENDAFQVLISDVNMPEMDGLTLARAVVDKALMDPASIIMLTSDARPDDAAELQSVGISQHLIKPAKQSEMYDAVVSSLSAMGINSDLPELVPQTTSPTGSLSELQILLAEDNVVNQKLAIGILEKLGHRVTVANNGSEALEQLEQHHFDLVLMDVQMPEMDGLAATRELRRREAPAKTHVPVVAMTAHAMKGDRERCLASGMDDYLCKPIRLKDVSQKLAELFPGSPTQAVTDHRHPANAGFDDVVAWPQALANVGGDHDLLCELIGLFLEDAPVLIRQAIEAARQDNIEALLSAAHTVKGSMLFLNPRQALCCARKVEELAAEGDLEASRNTLKELQAHFGAVCQSLQTYLDQNRK